VIEVYGAFAGMIIGRGNKVLEEKLPHCYFVLHKSHMTLPELELGSPRRKVGY
jgi:hypothetical protein